MTNYTYVFVRTDLSHPVQLVQACHAAYELGLRLPRPMGMMCRYESSGDNLIVIGVRDQDELLEARNRAERNSIRHHLFYEPDNDLGYTALCTEPVPESSKRLFSRYQILASP